MNFVKEWERKSEETQLRHFIEYLAYFYEAGGDICLDEEISDDAVQLMTVHAAKGLEFPNVFILRLSKNDFPSKVREVEFDQIGFDRAVLQRYVEINPHERALVGEIDLVDGAHWEG